MSEQNFPHEHLQRIQQVIAASVVEQKRGNWGAGVLRFNQYCNTIGVPEEGRMPAPEILLSLFVANYGAGKFTASCIASWMADIHRWHQLNGAPWHGARSLALTMKGAARLAPAHCRKSPITLQHLNALHANLDLTNSFDATVFAVACIAFYACCRLSELIILTTNSFDPKYHIARSCKITRGVARHGMTFTTLRMPWSKTLHELGDDLHLVDTGTPTSPVSALEHHLQCNLGIPDSAPLFSWRTAAGTWEPMTKEWFMGRCNAVYAAQGLEDINGHSYRIGGTTQHLLDGVDPWAVKFIGRWPSAAFLSYWREVEKILPDFISDNSTSVTATTKRMAQFVRSF